METQTVINQSESPSMTNKIGVRSVRRITRDEPVPVFDITNLDGHLTFCLHNGVVVHNTAKVARLQGFQETLPLKGKILNAARDDKGKAVESEEIINILAQIGFDPKADDPYSKLRVAGKIIMLADPDPDGPLVGETSLKIKWEGEWHQVTMEELSEDPWINRTYEVVSWNGHSTCLTDAQDCRITAHVTELIQITMEDGTKLTSHPKHKYPIKGSAILRGALPENTGLLMVPAESLKTGDRIMTLDDGGLQHEQHNATGKTQLGCSFVRKIRRIKCEERTPVYCLTVPVYHNFMLGNGVFSSNCHINSLLLSLIYKFLPELFTRGMIYVAETPEFYAMHKGKPYFGRRADDVSAQLSKMGSNSEIMHIKGYGEVSADILRLLAFDPATRNIVRILPCETPQGEVEFMKIMSGTSEARKAMLGI